MLLYYYLGGGGRENYPFALTIFEDFEVVLNNLWKNSHIILNFIFKTIQEFEWFSLICWEKKIVSET